MRNEPQLDSDNLMNYLPNFLIDKCNDSSMRKLKPPKSKYYSSDLQRIIEKNENKINVNNNYMIFPEQSNQYNPISFIFPNANMYNYRRSYSNPITHITKEIKNKYKKSLFKEEEYKSLNDILSSMNMTLVEYIKTQKGSRTLQKYFDIIKVNELDILIKSIKSDMSTIMMDTYGNYFSQKLLMVCSASQREEIIKEIKDDFIEISCDSIGTHSIQTFVEIKNTVNEELLLLSIIHNKVIFLSKDINGTHVMQKILSTIQPSHRSELNSIILKSISLLIYDQNGVCVLKKFMSTLENDEHITNVLSYIENNFLSIIQSSYGNYAIQHIFDIWSVERYPNIVTMIIDNIISLSMHKHSSNVIEKCIDIFKADYRNKMIAKLFDTMTISSMLKNKYGNIILLKAIHILSLSEKKVIKENLSKKLHLLSSKEQSRLFSFITEIL